MVHKSNLTTIWKNYLDFWIPEREDGTIPQCPNIKPATLVQIYPGLIQLCFWTQLRAIFLDNQDCNIFIYFPSLEKVFFLKKAWVC